MFTTIKQRGFTMIAAIFLLVGLAALGSFMVTFSNTQHITSAQDVQGSRAYWAAHAGLQWAIASLKATKACPVSPTSFVVDGFTLTIECAGRNYDEGVHTGVDARKIFRVTSVAASGGNVGSLGYVERSLSTSVEF